MPCCLEPFFPRRCGTCHLGWKPAFLCNVFTPKAEALEVVQEITAIVSALPQDQLWLMGADFNFTPSENIFQHLAPLACTCLSQTAQPGGMALDISITL